MMKTICRKSLTARILLVMVGLALLSVAADAAIVVQGEKQTDGSWTFPTLGVAPSATDQASYGTFTAGTTLHGSSAPVSALNNGAVMANDNDTSQAVFFPNSDTPAPPRMFYLDLGARLTITNINVYSRHIAVARAQQAYFLYGNATTNGSRPADGDSSWILIGSVHTLSEAGTTNSGYSAGFFGNYFNLSDNPAGQYVTKWSNNSGGSIGAYRYLRFDTWPPYLNNIGQQTFFTEIDVFASAAIVVQGAKQTDGSWTFPMLAQSVAPSATDQATYGTFTAGAPLHGSSAPVSALNNGAVMANDNDLSQAVFFTGSTTPAPPRMFYLDLGSPLIITNLNVYSRHSNQGRADQAYFLYGNATAGGVRPADGDSSWILIGSVYTESDAFAQATTYTAGFFNTYLNLTDSANNNQYATKWSHNRGGSIGTYRYLRFDTWPRELNSIGNQTFFTEIDVFGTPPPPRGTMISIR